MITAPYSFVPLNSKIYYPDWANKVSHDIPFSDGEDGYIEVEFKNITPLFTRNGSKKDEKEIYSSHIVMPDGTKRYFIPGTSIKGMLRLVMEIMAFGKLTQYQNRWFGYRFVTQNNKNKVSSEHEVLSNQYKTLVAKGKPGWLTRIGEKYYFQFCEGDCEKIPQKDLKNIFSAFKSDTSVWKTNCSLSSGSKPVYPEYKHNGSSYRIVCTGNMKGKEHELLFPLELGDKIELDEETINAFKTVYSTSPDFEKCYLKELDKGGAIPVFYLKRDGLFDVIGFSKMFRIPYSQSLSDAVGKEQIPSERLDLCDIIWGYTNKTEALKGRVQVGHAFMTGTIGDKELIEVKGVLGQPNPSYYPLYLKQSTNPYKKYDSSEGISGRKLYKIHKHTTELPQGNDNKNTLSKFCPIPNNQTFRLRINLHNMRKIEIGALLAALTLNHNDECYHNIGLAKSFGYGKIKVSNIELKGFEHSEEEYLEAFERELTRFTYYEYNHTLWRDSIQIKKLFGILSEHKDEDTKMMPLGDNKNEGYSFYKSDKNFCLPPKEPSININSFINTDIVQEIVKGMEEYKAKEALQNFHSQNIQLYEEALQLKNEHKLHEALVLYNKIEDKLLHAGLNSTDIAHIINDLEMQIKEEDECAKAKELETAKQNYANLYPTISCLIDEKYVEGPNTGKYKVTNAKVLKDKIKKWRKEHGNMLTNEDKEQIRNTCLRLGITYDKLGIE